MGLFNNETAWTTLSQLSHRRGNSLAPWYTDLVYNLGVLSGPEERANKFSAELQEIINETEQGRRTEYGPVTIQALQQLIILNESTDWSNLGSFQLLLDAVEKLIDEGASWEIK